MVPYACRGLFGAGLRAYVTILLLGPSWERLEGVWYHTRSGVFLGEASEHIVA
jgi:hypothetical protein